LETALQTYLAENIPITTAMGIKVVIASPARVLLECPLEPNRNHRGTGFGGSIASIATLAGWAWIWVMMRERTVPPNIVISKSSIEYTHPVQASFSAELRPPSDAQIRSFIDSFDRRGSARIELKVDVLCQGEEAALFTGVFVAVKS
jgi:thioesterase domain-containing protein